MESTTELIQQLISSSSPNEKVLVLKRLKMMTSDKGFVIANAKRLFIELKSLISIINETTIPTIDFITTLVMSSKDPEVYAQVPAIYSMLISSLGLVDSVLLESINNCFCACVYNSIGLDVVLSSIQIDGLSSDDSVTRKRSAELLLNLAKRYPQLVDDSKYGYQLIHILEDLIKRPNEFSEILGRLTQTHPTIYKVSKRLHASFKTAYNDILNKRNIQINESDPNVYKEIDDAITAEISKKFTFAENFEIKGELKYGVIPERLLKDLQSMSNWKQRAGAIEELEEIIANQKSYTPLRPHIGFFMQYLVTLLSDTNYKVAVTTLQIINKLLKECLEFFSSESVDSLVPELIDKLGDNKVMIRQLAIFALRLVGKIVGEDRLINRVLPYLSSPKWHTREEILNYLIISFIENGNTINIEYTELVRQMLPLSYDDKPKVVQVVFEAYATIANFIGTTKILGIIQSLTKDEELISRIKYRFEAGEIPILTHEGNLEFPHISSELITQNSFYSAAKNKVKNSSRFTSAGPVNRVPERNYFEVHSAIRRPQTNNNIVSFCLS